jgi:hypothetical protein
MLQIYGSKKKILQAKKWLILIITAKPSITRFTPLRRERIHWRRGEQMWRLDSRGGYLWRAGLHFKLD